MTAALALIAAYRAGGTVDQLVAAMAGAPR